MRPRLFLIDSFGYIFRAYHARARSGAPPMRTKAGLPTEVVYIFGSMMRKLTATHKPEYVAAVFESAGPTFREQEFADYKANRPEAPPDLVEQIPYVRRMLEAMRIPVLEFEGYEADDVIGTIARRAAEAGIDVVIVSADKDMMQLVGEGVAMLNPTKDERLFDAARVEEAMGVPPSRVPDLLALKGDAVDNIPGAPGIGDKGAQELIRRFGSVEQALEHAAEVERKMYRESLQNNRDVVLMSKRLATIDTGVPIEWALEDAASQTPDAARLADLYRELEFHSLLESLAPAESKPAEPSAEDHATLESAELVTAYLEAIPGGTVVAVTYSATPEGALMGENAFAIAWKPGEARAVPIELLSAVRPLLEDASRPKVAYNLKSLLLLSEREGVVARGFTDDVMLEGFVLDADPGGCTLEALARNRLARNVAAGAAAQAGATLDLHAVLSAQMDARGVRDVYARIEMPLVPVLARMERVGIRVAPDELGKLSGEMEARIDRLTAEIHALAKHPFNINSPQQLGKVLFEEMGLAAPPKRGKSKSVSTAADVLEELAAEHEIAGKVLEYRQLTKLKGTYVDALPQLISAETGRLHTNLNQTGAATGRLSSSNPNLQNIPIRTKLGREIRAAFVPRDGWKLIVADYSQIELRLLAHMSGDPVLVEAFRNGEDIHTRTAAEVFGVAPLMVTPELRRNAKAVNFGIIYGLSAFGLSAQLGIPRQEAERYIQGYFERYRGVKAFIERAIAEVRESGISRTLFGRLRPIPDINSRNPNARGFAERTAVNTPLQGTAADLIKLAMIKIDGALSEGGYRTAMLLQVHDELLFEAPPDEVDAVAALVKREMESVHRLEVPLIVDVGVGANWRDAK
jgi:DNA polymerase-1